jgi:hypothetical protein
MLQKLGFSDMGIGNETKESSFFHLAANKNFRNKKRYA